MSRAAGLLLGLVLLALCACAAVEGVRLVNRAAGLRPFTDMERAELLRELLPPEDREARDAFKAEWWREMDGLRTGKWELQDRGSGLLSLTGTGFAAILALRLWDLRNLRRARTPASKRTFLGLGVLAWVGLIPAEWLALAELAGRGEVPHWADSWGLPALSTLILVLGTLPIALGFAWFGALRRARLPVSLWLWDRDRPVRSLLWSTFWGAVALVLMVALAVAAELGHALTVPLLAVLLYLALAARAAALSCPAAATGLTPGPPATYQPATK